MQQFSPANYDFTILATSSRLMENEVYLMKHLENFQREYVIVRTKVDSEVYSKMGGRVKNKEKIIDWIEKIKRDFYREISQLKPNKVFFTGVPIKVEDTGEVIDFNDEYKSII